MTCKKDTITPLSFADFNLPVIAFLSIFTYQYLFPQYFFNSLYALQIPSISVGLCIVFALLGWKKESYKYVKREMTCFIILLILFFCARFFVTDPQSTKSYCKEHLHAIAIGVVFVFYFRKINLLNFFTKLLILYILFAAHIGIAEGGRIWGHNFLQDENQISALMAMVIPVAFYYSCFTKEKKYKIICYAGIILFVTLSVVSFSRGGFLALSTVLLCILWSSKKKILAGLLVALVIIGVVMFAPDKFFSEVKTLEQGITEGTAAGRIEYWRRAYIMFKESPVFGKGIGQFPVLSHKYALPGKEIGRPDFLVCHSCWFQILSELGIVGIICYSLIFYDYFKSWQMIKKRKVEDESTSMPEQTYLFYKNISTGLAAGMVGFMVAGTFINIMIFPYYYTFTFFMMAIKSSYLTEIENMRQSGIS